MPFNQDGLLVDQPQTTEPPPGQSIPGQIVQPQGPGGGGGGGLPLPPELLQALGRGQIPTNPNRPGASAPGPPKVPASPDERADLWRNLLGDFVWSLAGGAKASSEAPPGQRSRAAFGGALMGPYQRRKSSQDLELAQAKEDQLKATIENLFEKLDIERAKIPVYVQEAMSKIGKTTAETGKISAQTETEDALRPGKVTALDTKSMLDLTTALSKEVIHVKTPDGGEKIFNLLDLINGGGEIKPLTSTGDQVQITIPKQMAETLGQPGLAGQTVGLKIGSQLAQMAVSAIHTTATGKGVISRNLLTGEKENMGPPAGVAGAGARFISVIGPDGLPHMQQVAEAAEQGSVPGTLSDVNKLTGQSASFANLHSNVNEVMRLADVVKPGRTTVIASAMAQPPTQMAAYLQGAISKGELSQEEYAFINALGTLREDMFNMRQFFGNSPIRSDRQVGLMLNQVPDISDIATGSPDAIRAKLNNWMRAVGAVEAKYGPLMSIIGGSANKPGGTPTIPAGGSIPPAGGPRAAVPPPSSTTDRANRLRQIQSGGRR